MSVIYLFHFLLIIARFYQNRPLASRVSIEQNQVTEYIGICGFYPYPYRGYKYTKSSICRAKWLYTYGLSLNILDYVWNVIENIFLAVNGYVDINVHLPPIHHCVKKDIFCELIVKGIDSLFCQYHINCISSKHGYQFCKSLPNIYLNWVTLNSITAVVFVRSILNGIVYISL